MKKNYDRHVSETELRKNGNSIEDNNLRVKSSYAIRLYSISCHHGSKIKNENVTQETFWSNSHLQNDIFEKERVGFLVCSEILSQPPAKFKAKVQC